MAYLTPDEIKTHLYGEVVSEINRTDNTIVQSAIDAAVEEARGYLSAYDTTAVFAAEGANRNPALLLFIKDIAVWHFIQLANPAVDMQLRLDRYEKAVSWLDKVQRGQVVPNLPYPSDNGDGSGNGSENYIKWGSVPPRHNYF